MPVTIDGTRFVIGGTRCNGAQGPRIYVVANPDPAVPPPDAGDVAAGALDGFAWPDPTTSTVTATPTRLHFDAGDGNARSCERSGTIATTAAAYNDAPSDCSYTYYPHSSTTVGAKYCAAIGSEYHVPWSSSIGPSGAFPNRTVTTRNDVPVGAMQALVTK